MKLTYILFFTVFFQINASGYSQGTEIDLNLENESIENVLEKVEELTNFKFLYNSNSINVTRKVTIKAENEPLKSVLKRLFSDTNVSFKFVDRQVILTLTDQNKSSTPKVNKTSQLVKPNKGSFQKVVSGYVFDNYKTPIPGTNVIVKGTQTVTYTDFDGYYEIQCTTGDILYFTSLGFKDTEVVVSDDTIYDVILEDSAVSLDQVELFFSGYEEISEERITGSFENLGEETLNRKANQNILSKLEGEVSGVLFGVNGDANDLESISIRGLGSLNANTAPLIVVDGFPIEGNFNNINPSDIESITVLKDASAASIWGIRAANGVIVIKTKKGENNKKLTVDLNVTTSYTPKVDVKDNRIAGPSAQVDYYQGLYNAGLFNGISLSSGELNERTFSQFNPVVEALLLAENGQITDQEAANRLATLRGVDGRDEYSNLFVRPERWTQYNVALSGGGKQNDYRASLTYNKNEGSLVSNKSDQIIANIGNSFDLNSKFHLQTNINAMFANRNFAPETKSVDIPSQFGIDAVSYLSNVPINSRILDTNGGYLPTVGFGASRQNSELALSRGFLQPWEYNLKQEFDNNNNTSKDTELRLQSKLSYDISDAFTAEARYQYETSIRRFSNIYNKNRYITRTLINTFSQTENGGNVISNPIPNNSIADFTDQFINSHTFRGQLNYDDDFDNGKHEINALVGYEARKVISETRDRRLYDYDDRELSRQNLNFQTQYDLVLGGTSGIPDPSAKDVYVENRFLSYYGNFGYTFDNRYTLTGSARLDDTNLFGASSKSRNVPLYSVGLKWNVTNELFFNVPAINNLQLRGSYGINGNVDRNTSPLLLASSSAAANLYTNRRFGFISSLPNPTLRLEKAKTINLGLDISLWSNLIEANIDVYQKNSEDLLSPITLNSTSGNSSLLVNSGNLENQGIDAGLTLNLVSTDNVSFSTSGNFSYNKNKVTEVGEEGSNVFDFIRGGTSLKGDALRTIYSFNYAGLDREGKPQFLNEKGEIVDYTTAITDREALVKEGTEVPVYYGSWINDFSFKNWSLRTLMTFRAGHVFRNENVYNPSNSGQAGNTYVGFNNRWQQAGDENNTDVPAQVTSASDNFAEGYINYLASDKFVDNAATIRLREIILAYSFAPELLKSLNMSSLQLSVQANNVKVWNFNKWNIDPQNQFLPVQPRFTFSLNTTF